MAESVTLTVTLQSQIGEVLSPAIVPGALAASDRTVNHNKGGVSKTILDTETPHPVVTVVRDIVFDGDEYYELNFVAAPTTGAPDAGEDLTGKRLMYIELETPDDNAEAVLVKPADADGYHLWGNAFQVSVPPYANLGFLLRGQTLPLVSSGAKLLRFEGAEGDTISVKLCFA